MVQIVLNLCNEILSQKRRKRIEKESLTKVRRQQETKTLGRALVLGCHPVLARSGNTLGYYKKMLGLDIQAQS